MPASRPQIRIEAPPEKLRALQQLRAENERLRRLTLRRRWASPGEMARDLEPTTRQTPALDRIDAAVVDVFHGRVTKQQLAAPPQTGKSQRVSRWTPLWMLACDPTLRIAIVSAEKNLAERWGRQIKRDIEAHPELGLSLMQDSQAAGRWETEQGGGVFCTGVKAGTTGRPIDVLIIDDPIGDRADAESKAQRERVWEFWENDAGVRARKTIVMATRWHVDDLSGRLLEREAGQWRSLSIPAIAGEDDPLGRAPGEELTSANPELHPPGYYLAKQATTSAYVFSALFQQSPTVGEGNIFKRGDWRYWTAGAEGFISLDGQLRRLDDCQRFLTIDLASSTKTSADFTVASAWAITVGGELLLLDRRRERVPEEDHAAFVAPLRQRWLNPFDVTYVESRMFGTTLVYAMGRAGVPIAELEADTDKVTRALPYANNLVRQNRVWLPRTAPWLDEWLDEHADFPNGKNDDQVDTGAYAARVVLAHWLGQESAETTHDRDARIASADGIDFMRVAY